MNEILNPSPSPENQASTTPQQPASQPTPQIDSKIKGHFIILGFVLLSIFLVGMMYLGGLEPDPTASGGQAYGYSTWLVIAYLAGLSMIFLPCTFPLVFVIVPLVLSKGYKKGFIMAILFGLGLSVTLSIYGVGMAYLGQRIGLDKATEGLFIFGGLLAYLFGLAELGYINFKIPTYSGELPKFVQAKNDYLKTFFLGLFLGNAGVGCPNPWFYFLLAYITTSGDVFKGLSLGFIHGVGRAIPLLLLAVLGLVGLNYTSKILINKTKVERGLGWSLTFIGAFILANGVFSHEWYVQSGLHSYWERITEFVMGTRFGERIEHIHVAMQSGFYTLGNYILVGLFVFPMLWYLARTYIKCPWDIKISEIIFKLMVIVIVLGSFYPLLTHFDNGTTQTIVSNIGLIIGVVVAWAWNKNDILGLIKKTPAAAEPVVLSAEDKIKTMKAGITATIKVIVTTIILLMLFTQYFPNSVKDTEDHKEYKIMSAEAGLSNEITIHNTKIKLILNPETVVPGSLTTFQFLLLDATTTLPVKNLQTIHTKPMHVILAREDLNHFSHLHPELINDQYSVQHTLPEEGYYKLWVEFTAHDITHLAGFEFKTTNVTGKNNNLLVQDMSQEKKIDEYLVKLQFGKLTANKPSHLTFTVTDSNGIAVNKFENYLGATAHVIAISQDMENFGHAHIEKNDSKHEGDHHGFNLIPIAHAGPGHGAGNDDHKSTDSNLETSYTFKKSGIYKLWLQFQINQKVITSDFMVRVE